VSTLWTPSGEHPVPRNPEGGAPSSGSPPGGTTGRAPSDRPAGDGSGRRDGGGGHGPGPNPEEVRRAEEEMDAVREQLLHAPVEVVVANHAMGLWELAALHLSQQPPGLPEAQLAIDALGALLDGLRGRLGEPEKTLADGLAELRMAFVQIANAERTRERPGT
jgi:hypothetical protein